MTIFNNFVKILLLMLVLASQSYANAIKYSNSSINALIDANIEPEGVVFELVEYKTDAWDWAAPKIKQLTGQLRHKYPNLDIAIISHGNEQFQLTRKNLAKNQNTVSLLNNLSKQGVGIHVCGVNSSWNGISEDAYIDIVDVAVSGPAKLNDYINLGYVPIMLNR
ncbi:MAG: DsrE family protein [Candidatus Thioglobus sp.]|nr:DsrE family protein [Candidatus Thioglobus pontius]MBL6976540.1 DsrE family protein [Candidatus Thioglobus sp.]MBL6983973.1 DsrE family protein [Candidatus Thioglobus sp.]